MVAVALVVVVELVVAVAVWAFVRSFVYSQPSVCGATEFRDSHSRISPNKTFRRIRSDLRESPRRRPRE